MFDINFLHLSSELKWLDSISSYAKHTLESLIAILENLHSMSQTLTFLGIFRGPFLHLDTIML